jgi:hypothetical protein
MGRGRFVTGLEFVGSIEPLAVSLLVDEEPEPPQM